MDYDQSVAGGIQKDRASQAAQKENDARHARASLTWTTVGIGETFTPNSQVFKLRFTEEPSFTSGFVLDDSTGIIFGHFPRVSAGVFAWQKDNQGCYIGAYIFFTVDTIGPGAILGNEPNYKIHHHLVFEGLAIKDLPAHLLDL